MHQAIITGQGTSPLLKWLSYFLKTQGDNMTEATITTKVYEYKHDPGMEVVVLTANNDETYRSVKFKTVLAAIATVNADISTQATDMAVTISGQVVTLRNADLSSTAVTLVLFGIK